MSNKSYLNFNPELYTDIIEEYITDLSNYIEALSNSRDNLSTYVRRYGLNELEAKYYPLLGFKLRDIQDDIAALQSPKKEETKHSYNLSEILDTYQSSSPWIVPNLLRSTGMYFLVAEPKTGKSLLMSNLIHSVAVSGTFLDRPCKTGKVLYFPLEDPKESVGERLFLSGFGDVYDPETSLVVNFADRVKIETKLDLNSDVTWLIDLINEYKPILTIIDTFRAATLRCGAEENSNSIGKLALVLQQIFHATESCGIVVHHMNKSGGRSKTSLVERVAGHGSIAGASDGIIGLEAEDTQEGRLISLKTAPRHGTSCSIKYKLNLDISNGGLWKLTKVWEDSPIDTPMCSAILRLLFDNITSNRKLTYKQLAAGVGAAVNNTEFSKIISWLLNNQIISRDYDNNRRQFLFYIHPESTWMVQKTSIYDSVSKDVLDANRLMQCRTKKELRFLFDEWHWNTELLSKSLKMLLPKEKARIRTLIKEPEFETGDLVEVIKTGVIGEVVQTQIETNLDAKLDFSVTVRTEDDILLYVKESELVLVDLDEEDDTAELPTVDNLNLYPPFEGDIDILATSGQQRESSFSSEYSEAWDEDCDDDDDFEDED